MRARRGTTRGFAALVAAMITVAGGTGTAAGVAGFGDVADARYFTAPVQWMVDNDVTTGVAPNCFATSRATTRGEAAAFIWRAEGRPTPGPSHAFADVTAPWQQDPVSWMADNGITTGTSSTTFSAERLVTRGEFAAFLYRLAGEPAPGPTHAFGDVTAPWQQDPVSWMANNGITTGTGPTTFSPERSLSRGEAATFLYRFAGEPPVTVDQSAPACLPWHRGGVNPTPEAAVEEFVEFVGLNQPTLSEFRQGDSRSGEIEITTTPTSSSTNTTTTAFVRLDSTDSWVVIGAVSDAIEVTQPTPDATVGSPILTSFTHLNFARTIVEVWPDGSAEPAASRDLSPGTVLATIDVPSEVTGPATLVYVSEPPAPLSGGRLAVTTQRVVIVP